MLELLSSHELPQRGSVVKKKKQFGRQRGRSVIAGDCVLCIRSVIGIAFGSIGNAGREWVEESDAQGLLQRTLEGRRLTLVVVRGFGT